MGNSDLYKNDKSAILGKKERLKEITALLNEAYAGWEALEQLKNEPGT